MTSFSVHKTITILEKDTLIPSPSDSRLFSASQYRNSIFTCSFPHLYEATAYFARIKEVKLKGPALRAVLEINPSALKQEAELDEERKLKGKIPMLLKDNIGTKSAEGSVVPESDAGVFKKLRKAGAIILGSTVAISIGLGALAVGTDTSGSITFPTSRSDTVDDRQSFRFADIKTQSNLWHVQLQQDQTQTSPLPNYISTLDPNALSGKHIGVPRKIYIDDTTHRTSADLPSADELIKAGWADEKLICLVEFKIDVNRYLSKLNENPRECTKISLLTKSNLAEGFTENVLESLARKVKLSGEQGIDAVLARYNLDALVARSLDLSICSVSQRRVSDDSSEYQLIGMAYAFERKTQTRMKRRAYDEPVPKTQLGDVIGQK
ncbi:hypothetical protein BT96DRAFT_1021153 [Gymnopus androsaceus JB14]|uniref:Amidase domain-containing protein n=1 Tax=Gymnopus androsaceus JB14 TaxID=1447944 RepID=A0A6A4HH26_9AGAR|nr:hypothetical protein BT96DRAFT_1021153 [Gymnopus androsaceus JB14]